ncbi:hypothetical protein [Sphingomonas sp. UNC305MFCol5.2]|uniref:hypothetical protein n=1 Tax=Sphingomonas sp. UNC305MFCol5.2 TaxID=1449076 RepID=UPI0012DCEFCD|nr:hypothetical protein [Sphingomonas sp. UNC305MFCol5.2]
MRDRGISSPRTKAWVAGAFALSGAIALLWGLQSPDPALQEASTAKTLGIVVLVIALLMAANYLYAQSLINKMRRGDDVIGRWTVAPDAFAIFRDNELRRKKRKNNWRLPRGNWPEGLEVIFTRRSVLVGNTWFRLATKGMSRFANARIETDAVSSIEFSMRLTIRGAGSTHQSARYNGHLRIPIAGSATVEAARVVEYFKDLV